jgi:hypothetical protein
MVTLAILSFASQTHVDIGYVGCYGFGIEEVFLNNRFVIAYSQTWPHLYYEGEGEVVLGLAMMLRGENSGSKILIICVESAIFLFSVSIVFT